ncbi:hypothetical protein, partial [Longimicrobium sp.]|uniref:hypothetical protein n=1 Tax=Longimicrobium sp. TaxID=2029185 RepID=UPI002E36E69A
MKAEYDDEMRREYDFAGAVRGRFASRWTQEQRERILRDSAVGTVWAWRSFALTRVQNLEASLFTLLVLGTGANPRRRVRPNTRAFDARPSHALSRLVRDLRRRDVLPGELDQRLDALVREGEWLLANDAAGADGNSAEQRAHVERLEQIGRDADALREAADGLIRHRLEASGLSVPEIERRTEETARLWL